MALDERCGITVSLNVCAMNFKIQLDGTYSATTNRQLLKSKVEASIPTQAYVVYDQAPCHSGVV